MTTAGSSATRSGSAAQLPPRPNILFVFSDQQHWQAIGFEDTFFATPNIDRLAAEGVIFESSFCTTPQCSPSRSSLLTGFYPSKTGVLGNVGSAGGDPLTQETVAAALHRAGYRTGYFGKWHLGNDPRSRSGWTEFAVGDESDGERTLKAVAFLKSAANNPQPFACFVSYDNPHHIYDFSPEIRPSLKDIPLPESWHQEDLSRKPRPQLDFMRIDQGKTIWGKEQPSWEAYRELYRKKVAEYDGCVGELLDTVSGCGRHDDTIVFATSDHGDMDTNHKLIFKGPFMYEHLMRVPLIVRVPGRFGARIRNRCGDLVVNTDLVPTKLDFAGADVPECDGRSLKPLLTGEGLWSPRAFVIGQYYSKQRWCNPIRMLRTDALKYNRYIRFGEELYDLANDPHELINRADDPAYASRKRELVAMLEGWLRSNGDAFAAQRVTDREGSFV
jgi:arylsulfatase